MKDEGTQDPIGDRVVSSVLTTDGLAHRKEGHLKLGVPPSPVSDIRVLNLSPPSR